MKLLAPTFLMVAAAVVACDDSEGTEISCCNPPAPMQVCPEELPVAGEECTLNSWDCDIGNGNCVWAPNCFFSEPECGTAVCRGVWDVTACSGPAVGGAGGEGGSSGGGGGEDVNGGAGGLGAGGLSGEE